MLNITLDDFVALINEHWVDWDGAFGNQCFDLAQFWNKVLGGSPFTGATADLIYNQPQDIYTQVANTPENFPVAGDIICWNWPHVGIVISADTNEVTVLEQNDPKDSNCHVKTYNYNGVIGWLHPKQLPQSTQAVLEDLRTARDTNWNLYEAEVTKNAQLSQNVATLQGQVNDYKSKYEADENTIIALKGQVTDIANTLAKVSSEDKQYTQEALDAQHNLGALQGRFTTLLGLIALSPDATDSQIKTRVEAILTPHEVLVKETIPVIEQLWQAAVYKRVPRVQSFLSTIWSKIIYFLTR